MPGSVSDPVQLDPWQSIVEVGWPSGGPVFFRSSFTVTVAATNTTGFPPPDPTDPPPPAGVPRTNVYTEGSELRWQSSGSTVPGIGDKSVLIRGYGLDGTDYGNFASTVEWPTLGGQVFGTGSIFAIKQAEGPPFGVNTGEWVGVTGPPIPDLPANNLNLNTSVLDIVSQTTRSFHPWVQYILSGPFYVSSQTLTEWWTYNPDYHQKWTTPIGLNLTGLTCEVTIGGVATTLQMVGTASTKQSIIDANDVGARTLHYIFRKVSA